MKILLKYLKPHKWLIIISLTLAGVSQLLHLVDPLIFGKIIDDYATNPGELTERELTLGVLYWLGIAIAVALLARLAKSFQEYFTRLTVNKFGMQIFNDGLKQTLRLSFQEFEEQRSGETLSVLQKVKNAGLQSGELGHVIIILGKQYCNFKWRDVPKSHFQSHGKEVSYYDASNIPNKYVVHDDNLIPYRIIDLAHPGQHYIDEEYKDYVIDGIVVPLYPKIYLESVVAKELVFQILKDNSLGYDFSNNFVFRFYLTSSRSFKNHIVTLTEMNQTLRNNLQLSRMPKFIWCAEIYDTISFKTQQTAKGIVVLDATEANQDSIDALIFAGYPDRCIIVNENNFVTLQQIFNNYKYFSNLN